VFVPKGEINSGEDELAAASANSRKTACHRPRSNPARQCQTQKRKKGHAWLSRAMRPTALRQQHLQMECPRRSGKMREFPEIDLAAFFTIQAAREKMHPAEFAFVTRRAELVSHV